MIKLSIRKDFPPILGHHITHLLLPHYVIRIADKVKKPPIQDAVEKATSEMLLQPDWENNIVICDAIQQKPEL